MYVSGGLGAPEATSEIPPPELPSMLTFILFVEWGREDAADTLASYFIVPNNSQGMDLSVIKTCGGEKTHFCSPFRK